MPLALPQSAIISLVLIAAPALAQSDQSDQSDLLKGPSIPTQTQHILGSTTMNGHFTPVEGRPELAAFALVTNDPDHLAKARDLENKRIFDLTAYLVNEIDTVRAITEALNAGNGIQTQILLAQLRLRYDPGLSKNPLLPELEKMLDTNQRAELTRILNEYWLRWAQSKSDNTTLKPNSPTYKKIENQLNNKLFEHDIRFAYEHALQKYQSFLDTITTAIQPTDDQQKQISELIVNHIKKTKLKATNAQRQTLMLEIYRLLDEQRKEQLFLFMASAAIDNN